MPFITGTMALDDLIDATVLIYKIWERLPEEYRKPFLMKLKESAVRIEASCKPYSSFAPKDDT